MTVHPHIRKQQASTAPTRSHTQAIPPSDVPNGTWAWSGFAISCAFSPPMMISLSASQIRSVDLAPGGGQGAFVPPFIDPPTLSAWCRPPEADETWLRPHVRKAFKGSVDLQIYVAGCKGLAYLHKAIGAPIFKIGTTEAPSPCDRLVDFGERSYGSLYRHDGAWTTSAGYEEWTALEPRLDTFPSLASPVVILPASIGVRLPRNMSARAFDQALNERLRDVAVDRWVRAPGVPEQLQRSGTPPDLAIRATPVGHDGVRKVQEVAELYFFRKKYEFKGLVAMAEAIVLEAVSRDCEAHTSD
jgi:hypothetical protein